MKLALGRSGSRIHGDPCIGVGGIAHNEDADVARGDFVHRLALLDENLGVFHEQVFALHAGATRPGAHQHGVVGVLEGNFGIARADHIDQQGESAVFEFHHYAFEGCLYFING